LCVQFHFFPSLLFFHFTYCNGDTIAIVVVDEFCPFLKTFARVLFPLCSEVENECMRVMGLLTNYYLASNIRLLVESAWNVVILHHFNFYYNFDLLMTKEVGDWVKVQNTIWYLNFLMTQHENSKCIEHL
jgi:hypothetical protein